MKEKASDLLYNQLQIASKTGSLMVNTHHIYQVVRVSDNGKFVDIVNCNLVWRLDEYSEQYVINSYGRAIPASPAEPEIIYDVPVKQYREGDFQIRKRPKVGDIGYIECFYQDISSWKKEGGIITPISINIHDIESCVFVNGLVSHKEDDDVLPAQNIFQLKGRTTLFELQDATVKNEETQEEAMPSKITAKITDNTKIEIIDPADSGLEIPQSASLTIGSVNINIEIPKEGDPVININAGTSIINASAKTLNATISDGANITSNVTITGDLTVSGEVTGKGIALSTHTHQYEDTQPNGTPATKSTQTPQ